MKRTILFLLAIVFAGANIFAQSVIYQDDFESYTVGGYLAEQSPDWTTWSNDPGSEEDALISDDYALSGSNSVKVEGLTDLVLPLGDKQNGVFEISFSYYIETGYGGYYNLQHFEAVGTEWAVEVFFGSNGDGEIKTDGSIFPFTYTVGAWTDIVNEVDMDADEARIWIDGNLVHTWTWSTISQGGAGANQLGALNVWAGAMTGDDPLYYFDDVTYEQLFAPLYEETFESYALNSFIAVENPEWWETWSNNPGSSEDGPIVDEQAFNGDQSLKVTGVTDLIFLLGDKAAGQFDVNWMFYVPSGNEGYYNFQHMEAPGTEWAIEVWFYVDGTGEVKVDGGSVPFTFDHDTWIDIDNNINLDDDIAEMYFNGNLLHTWTWSTISQGGPGTNQLGSVNFYAGASSGQNPLYYVDDIFYMQSGGATDPAMELSQTMFEDTIGQGTAEDRMLTVSNTGGADLEYLISVVYDVTDKKDIIVPMGRSMIKAKGNAGFEMIEMPKPGGAAPATDDVTLHYDGPNDNSVGLLNPNEWEAAAKFPASMVNQYAGMELYKVIVFVNDPDPADDMAIKIYGMNQDYLPGDLLVEQAFTPVQIDWNEIVLDAPIPVTGEDLWVACYVNQTTLTHPIGTDAGPAVYNGDWISTGPGWGHISPGIDANWNIQAVLQGDPIEGWLSVSPENGTITAGNFDDVTVTYDASNLELGEYNANLVFITNDPENQFLEVPVTLTVVDATGIGDDDVSRIEMLVYPNPARNMVNVQSNLTIERLSIYNHIGQAVAEQYVNNTVTNVNVEGIGSGVYFIRIETPNGYTTQKLVIE